MASIKIRINQSKIESYCFRIKAAGITVDMEKLKEKLQKLDSKFLDETLTKIVSGKEEDILASLKAIGINAVSDRITTIKAKEEVVKKLNLSDITEFENNNMRYFKFKDKDGNVIVTRNLGNDSKELFLDILNNSNVAEKHDGKENAADIFKFLNNKKLIEINTKNSKNIEQDKNKAVDKAIVKEIQKRFPDKEIIYSAEERLYIVKGEKEEHDIVLSVHKQNGKFAVNQIEQKGYEDQNVVKKEETVTYNDQDITLEFENDEEINSIIIFNTEQGISDDITMEQLANNIRGRYPQYSNKANLNELIVTIIARIKEKKAISKDKGRQYVLVNNNKNNNNNAA